MLPAFSASLSAGIFGPATVTGTVWNDPDQDGFTLTELAGETVYLDVNNNMAYDDGEPTATTDVDGAYSFTTTHFGNQIVRYLPRQGVRPLGPVTYAWRDSEGNGDGVFAAPTIAQWYDISGVGTSFQSDQQTDFYALMPLPFAFPFYGKMRYSMAVTEKGYISFDENYHSYGTQQMGDLPQNGQADWTTILQDFPIVYSSDFPHDNHADYEGRLFDERNPTDIIAAYWRDLGTSLSDTGSGTMYYYHDTIENRVIIQWQEVSDYGFGGGMALGPANYTFQIQLYSDGRIYVVFEDMLPADFGGAFLPGVSDLEIGDTGLEGVFYNVDHDNSFYRVVDISNILDVVTAAHSNYAIAFLPETGRSTTLAEDAFVDSLDFEVHVLEPIMLSGYCNDDDGDGLEGVTVYLDLNNNNNLDNDEPTAVTDISGYYQFFYDTELEEGTLLLPGTYVVREITPDGYTQRPFGTAADFFAIGLVRGEGEWPVSVQLDLATGDTLNSNYIPPIGDVQTLFYFFGDMATNPNTGETFVTGPITIHNNATGTLNCWLQPDTGKLLPLTANNLTHFTDAMFYKGGLYYFFEFDFPDMYVTSEYQLNKLMVYNPSTGITTYRGSIPVEIVPLAADVDESTGTIYLLAIDSNGFTYNLYTLDISSTWPTPSLIGSLPEDFNGSFIGGMTYNPEDGKLYVSVQSVNDPYEGVTITRIDFGEGLMLTPVTPMIPNYMLMDIDVVNRNQTAYTITAEAGAFVESLNFTNEYSFTNPRIYVDANRPAEGANGMSWARAYPSLQSGLTAAQNALIADPEAEFAEVWVADGTYSPGTLTTSTFTLLNNVRIYGGFSGNEATLEARNWDTYATVLSGAGQTPNLHVVSADGVDATSVLDGVIISGGRASGVSGVTAAGAGITLRNASPTLSNLTLSNNTANYQGGGLYGINSSPTLTGITFQSNSGRYFGGGAYFCGGNPVIERCTFISNTSSINGGGLFIINAPAVIRNSVFIGNTCALYGGGAYLENAINFSVNNNTFLNNSSSKNGQGGGLATDRASRGVIRNSIFWGNIGIRNKQIYNVNLSKVTVANNVIQLGYSPSANTIIVDPKLDVSGRPTSLTPSCLNTGVGTEPTDRLNNPRTLNEIGAFARVIAN